MKRDDVKTDAVEQLVAAFKESMIGITDAHIEKFVESPSLDAIEAYKNEIRITEKSVLDDGMQKGIPDQLELVKGLQEVRLEQTARYRKRLDLNSLD